MSNYVAANKNNEGRGITPTDDDGYNYFYYYNNNSSSSSTTNNNNSTHTQNLNIKSRKKSSNNYNNKTNLRNLKRNEKFFKKFQAEIESSIHTSTLANNTTNNKNISDLIDSTQTTTRTTIVEIRSINNNNNSVLVPESKLLKSTSIILPPPPLLKSSKSKFNLIDNDNLSTRQMMTTKPNLKKVSNIPVKLKTIDTKQQQQQVVMPANSMLLNQTNTSLKTNTTSTKTIDLANTNSLEDFNSSKNLSDEFESDLKPVFSKSLVNKIKNHYRSFNSDSMFSSIDANLDGSSDTKSSSNDTSTTSVVPALISDKLFKNGNTNGKTLMKPINSRARHSKSNSFESNSFLLNKNGFKSSKNNVPPKLKLPNKT